MADESRVALAGVRIGRAGELLDEARRLFDDGSYKSANNRAYYSFEKSVKALLALRSKDAKTHSGVLHLFNSEYVHDGSYFNHDDYMLFKDCEYIRSASDYDDFYIASKEECERQIDSAGYMLEKVKKFVEEYGGD